MKSRLAILGMLVTGMLFSTAGAGLAVSGLASSRRTTPRSSQYAADTPTPTPGARPTPADGDGEPGRRQRPASEGGVLPAEAENAPATGRRARRRERRRRPAAADAEDRRSPSARPRPRPRPSQLPFTGFAAIPVLLGGLALLTGGLILRRRTQQ